MYLFLQTHIYSEPWRLVSWKTRYIMGIFCIGVSVLPIRQHTEWKEILSSINNNNIKYFSELLLSRVRHKVLQWYDKWYMLSYYSVWNIKYRHALVSVHNLIIETHVPMLWAMYMVHVCRENILNWTNTHANVQKGYWCYRPKCLGT